MRIILAWLTAAAIRLLAWTWRVRIHGAPPRRTPVLFVLWHGDQLALCKIPSAAGIAALVSRSRDGRFAGQVARSLGLEVIEGSTSRGAVAGALGVVRRLKRGGAACLTADGPRGPRGRCGESARRVAALAGAQTVPLGVSAARMFRLRTWDRFMIPAPFSKIWVVVAEPLGVTPVQAGLRRAGRQARELRRREQGTSSVPRRRSLAGRAWLSLLAILMLMGILSYSTACDSEQRLARQRITSTDPTVRARSLRALRGSAEAADAALASRYFKDPSARVRRAAVMVVGAIAPRAHLSGLRGLLYDPSLEVRLVTIRILGESGIKGVAEDLFPLLEQRPRVLRRTVSQALQDLGFSPVQRARELALRQQRRHIEELGSGSDQIRAEAARALGRSGREGVIPMLQILLADPSPYVVQQAALAIGSILGSKAVPLLRPLARAVHPQDREAAASALALTGPEAALLLDELWGVAKEPSVKEAVLGALIAIEPWPGTRIPQDALCRALQDPAAGVAERAARLIQAGRLTGCQSSLHALANAAATGDPASLRRLSLIPSAAHGEALLAGVRRRYEAHRLQAERWIHPDQWRTMGGDKPPAASADPPNPPPAKSGEKALRGLLARFPPRPQPQVSMDPLLPPAISLDEVARGILWLHGISTARSWLLEVARVGEPEHRVAALQVLVDGKPAGESTYSPATRPANAGDGSAAPTGAGPQDPLVPLIKSALAHEHLPLRQLAARQCARLGPEALNMGLSLLQDKDPENQANGAVCLGTLGDPLAVEPLLKLLDQEGQLAALDALCQIGDHRATGPILRLLLEDHPAERLGERRFIIEGLGQLGDKVAAVALEQELTHPDRDVRLAAAHALATTARARSRLALQVCRVDFFADIRRACDKTLARLGGGSSADGR